ncbi:MAG: tetratricopeptide repeat protein [Anaerolineales bacterium]
MAYAWHDFNDLWDYSHPAKTEATFRAILAEAQGKRNADYILQLKTQIARTYSLRGKFDQAHALLDEIEKTMEPGSLIEVRYLLERGRTFNSNKQPEKAVLLFSHASALAEKLGADFFTVDALHMLGSAAPPEARMDWNLKAIEYAQQSSDERARGWLASLYNNTGWSLFDLKRYEEALHLFQKAIPLREQQGKAEPLSVAKWSVAKVLRVLGRVEEALAMQKALETGEADSFVSEEIGECLLALGKLTEAKPYFVRAYGKLKEIDWVAEDTERITRLKQLAGT